jgi:NAD(P)H-quinone oxidoreductase subunit 6
VNLAADVQMITFGVLAIAMIVTALGVVLLEQIVYSAFLLGGVFLSVSGLYLLLNADFVAAAQVLIYVGAVNVLILFAIMLVSNRKPFKAMKQQWLRRGVTAFICVGIFALLATMVLATPWAVNPTVNTASTVVQIGKHFFSDYLLPFELASVLLLMAMVGAIILARRDFIPDATPANQAAAEQALMLPERPRELTAVDDPRV